MAATLRLVLHVSLSGIAALALSRSTSLFVSALAPSPTTNCNSNNCLILGLGAVGKEVAQTIAGDFPLVYGTVRNTEATDQTDEDPSILRKIAFEKLCGSSTVPSTCSHVLVTIPPSSMGDNHLNNIYDSIVESLPDQSWIGVLSTTGVYGHHDGKWVDEDSDLLCQEGTNAARYRDYETEWQDRIQGTNHALYIFRCAGIYGPERSALHTLYKKGIPLTTAEAPGRYSTTTGRQPQITNRIHVTDVARAIAGGMKEPRDNYSTTHMFNLADDLPESRGVVMKYAEELLATNNITLPKTPPPTTRKASASSTRRAKRRTQELKRVSNKRMKTLLLKETGLAFPTYKEGLQAILALPNMTCVLPAVKDDR
ncbi:nad-dependent epimerase dehydratase [Seminavis robusta]|uniref:Nad-dependent epimerase dehydratase n=1 Tax=Seminavis robusta TaxID=568900 RepID=A0A9N8D8S4_9STRA|nr:nad-dependent epimerase dehydratase [Seminavis robusta]|eukprot:Sro17_g012610.1 nad-dependent epimerase dehydratase (369) ;mRNA; r:162915-164021